MTVDAVVVSGLGVVSPHGDDALAMFEALCQGRSAVQALFPELPKLAPVATAPFDESRWFTKLQLAGVDRVSQLAVAAADLALRDAGAPPRRWAPTANGSVSSPAAAWAAPRRWKPPTAPAWAARAACRR